MAVLSSRGRFCRARRTSGEAREDEWQSPRPPLLFNAPNQNRHATQDRKRWFPLTRRCKIASFTQCFYASVNSSCAQPPPPPPPRADPQALAFCLPWMANSRGWGLLSCQIPRGGDEKRGQMPCPPSILQHFSLTTQSEGLDGGYKCQLSVKILAICQLPVNPIHTLSRVVSFEAF